jgi:hypothetical protein
LLLTGGCATWRVETAPPAELVAQPNPPGRLRVTTQDGNRFNLSSPRVIGDSLLGFRDQQVVGVRVGEIRELATRHGSTGKTLGLIFGTAGVVLLTVAIIAGAGGSSVGLQ